MLGPGASSHGTFEPWGLWLGPCTPIPITRSVQRGQGSKLLLAKDKNSDFWGTTRVRPLQQPRLVIKKKKFMDLEIQLYFPVLLNFEFASSACQAYNQTSGQFRGSQSLNSSSQKSSKLNTVLTSLLLPVLFFTKTEASFLQTISQN